MEAGGNADRHEADLPVGIAAEKMADAAVRWSLIPSVDEDGNPVVSPDEIRVKQESDPDRPGIVPADPAETIG